MAVWRLDGSCGCSCSTRSGKRQARATAVQRLSTLAEPNGRREQACAGVSGVSEAMRAEKLERRLAETLPIELCIDGYTILVGPGALPVTVGGGQPDTVLLQHGLEKPLSIGEGRLLARPQAHRDDEHSALHPSSFGVRTAIYPQIRTRKRAAEQLDK
eukprot:CAMPEP_0181190090 /NCGR_PEP_ID=MMETSP1096-20121128/12005_1 /TAXON_ID=156174 ORGANISM="Chrysochromulina ericina, Strain CCMP281" /NCGR_SAMPLE_ID=MMETSP1096 /ASSEMBLY_ACC=CAM_ASM_000453 /LENGTH=157 /DNA_ID=CAMNT_0023279277 /DNA_START=335 /DNA_END=809 /DNA_ORIENTATION=+